MSNLIIEAYLNNRVGQALKLKREGKKEEPATGKSIKAWQRLNKALQA